MRYPVIAGNIAAERIHTQAMTTMMDHSIKKNHFLEVCIKNE